MWTLESLIFGNMTNLLMSMIADYMCIRMVTGKKMKVKYGWLLYLLLAAGLSLFVSMYTLKHIQEQGHWNYDPYMLTFELVAITSTVFLHAYIFKTILKRIVFFLSVFSGLLFVLLDDVVYFFRHALFAELNFSFEGQIAFNFLKALLCLSLLLLFYRKLANTRSLRILKKIFYYPNFALVVSIIITTIQILFVTTLQQMDIKNSQLLFFISISVYLILLAFYLFLFREYLREEKLKNSESLVIQQNNYMRHLESIQQELRKIHHDYKNVATGLYARVEAGDTEAAQEYISKQLLQMDQGLQLSIQQLNQLINIEVIELKTLLMTKIKEAEKQQVRLIVEVMEPITTVPMEIADLLRCGGILLDNAIEAAAKAKQKEVNIVLLKEKGKLSLVVKNSAYQLINLQRIWELGYSTKGTNRGLGLANLKEITQRYSNVLLETRIEQEYFVQIMTLADK